MPMDNAQGTCNIRRIKYLRIQKCVDKKMLNMIRESSRKLFWLHQGHVAQDERPDTLILILV